MGTDMLQPRTDGKIPKYKEVKYRFSNELTEATMLHTKMIPYEQTRDYDVICKQKKHYFGFPWPNGVESNTSTTDKDGYLYNCFINDSVDRYWVPKLHSFRA